MNGIKENGYVRWKGFLTTMGANFLTTMGIVFCLFLYVDSKMVPKDAFDQFEKRIIASLADIKIDLRAK